MKNPFDARAFRALALALPDVVEGAHMGHADFRVGKRIFASLGPDEDWGMVRLPPDLQVEYAEKHPDVFIPFPGAWGRQGCTRIELAAARRTTVKAALDAAWRNTSR